MKRDCRRELPASLESWPGSKGGNGVYHRIIAEIPEHSAYIEGFAGGAAVWRHIRPARRSWLVDRDPGVIAAWRDSRGGDDSTELIEGDWLDLVSSPASARRDAGSTSSLLAATADPETVVYLDPPYLLETRGEMRYRVEMWDDRRHRELLRWCSGAKCRVLVSGYWSPLYAEMLQGWRSIDYLAMTRGGTRQEWLWMNFGRPSMLHDARFSGAGFRERERIKRRRASWSSQFRAMGYGERQEVLAGLLGVMSDDAGG